MKRIQALHRNETVYYEVGSPKRYVTQYMNSKQNWPNMA